MTNQEAITKLTNIMHDDHYSWHPSILTAFNMAVDALKGAKGDCISRQQAISKAERWLYDGDDNRTIGEMLRDLPSAQPEQRWIPCSERLPEDGEKHYWVCTDTGYQCECRWTNINHFWTDLTTDWHWHIMDIPQYSAIIAWMPLPEPWKEGETE